MRQILSYGFLVLVLVALLGVHTTTSAQDNQTPQPIISASPVSTVGVGIAQPAPLSINSDIQWSPLVLTLQNNGGTFTVPVNGLIFLNIPYQPIAHLNFDPSILSLLPVEPMPVEPDMPAITPQPGLNTTYPQAFWRLLAIQPGITQLSLIPELCRRQPCPMMPIYNFSVTIIVSGAINPPPPPLPPHPMPPAPPVSADVYIGTAYLNQTVNIAPGQVVTLDLPFLALGRPVQLQFNPTILQPLPGQNLNVAQPGGWQFQMIGVGTTVLAVLDNTCMVDDRINCQVLPLFQVTLTTGPSTR